MQPVGYIALYIPSSRSLSFFIFLSLVVSWVLILYMGSLGSNLSAGCANNICTLVTYSSLSITTIATPLSSVSMTLSMSFLSWTNPNLSCLVRFGLGVWAFLSRELMSALCSMVSSSFNFGHTDSTAVM